MEKVELRKPAVSGKFYPAADKELNQQIESFIDKKAAKSDIIACMLPHAGYMYSGEVAAKTVSRINIKDKVILLGPNHTGYGVPFSIMTEGMWQTPLGKIKIDSVLAKKILNNSRHLKEDYQAHIYEHSLEVELPLLQYFKNDFEIVPFIFASGDIDILKEIARAIASVIKDSGLKDALTVIASSDMTHYEPQAQAEKKDKEAIEAILELNEDKLMQKIQRLGISMCGYAPVIVMLVSAKLLGAKSAELIKYRTSGDVTGDRDSVVGYAGITIY